MRLDIKPSDGKELTAPAPNHVIHDISDKENALRIQPSFVVIWESHGFNSGEKSAKESLSIL